MMYHSGKTQADADEAVQKGSKHVEPYVQFVNEKDGGARPKQKAKDHQEKSARNPHEAYPDVIENVWEHLAFDICADRQGTSSHVLKSSDIMQNVQIQYAVEKKISQDVVQAFEDIDVKYTVNKDRSPVVIIFEGEGSKSLSSEKILKIFQDEIFIMMDTHFVPLGSEEGLSVLERLKKEVPEVIRNSEAAVYYLESIKSLFIIGERTRFRKLLKELGIKPDEVPQLPNRTPVSIEDIDVTFHELMCLKYLDFEQHIKKKYNGLTVEYTLGQTQCVVSLKGTVCPSKGEVRNFLEAINKAPICLPKTFCYHLLFHENRERIPNANLNGYIQSILQTKHKRKLKFFIDKEESGIYHVSCLEKSDAELVAGILKDNIVYSSGQMQCEESWKLMQSLSKKGKLKFVRKPDNFFEMCYTSDFAHVVTSQLERDATVGETMTIPLPKVIIDFLKLYGGDILKDIQQQFRVQVNKIEDSAIVLKGENQMLKQSKSYLKDKLTSLRKSVPVTVSEKELNSLFPDLDEEMRKCHCSWRLKHSQPVKQRLSNCEYLASWTDPIGQLKLTVVKGFPWLINFNLHVVLANQSLFPLETESLNLTVMQGFMSTTSELVRLSGGNLKAAEYTAIFDTNNSGLGSKKAAAIVVMADMPTERVRISKKALQKQVTQLLRDAEDCQIQTVGINSFVLDNLLKSEDIVEGITKAVTEHSLSRKHRFIEECFVCCSDNWEMTLNFMDGYFRRKKGYCRVVYSEDIQLIHDKEPNIEVTVDFASLHEIKAEALVNTTRNDLKLDTGKVSRKILEKAGQQIQDECKEKYPDGINYGDVAITRSYNMKDYGNVKYIFHVAVPKYQYCRFRQILLCLVKKCLFQAEREGCSSIAFPALGVGNLNYPRRETAAAMFDAVDEFRSEAVKPKLKKIKMVTFQGDKRTCEAFEHEVWRRSKKFNKDVPGFAGAQNFSAGPDSIRIKAGDVSVIVATTKAEMFPSFAVHIFFKPGEKGYTVKSASKDPKSWNDHIYLHGIRNVRDMQNSLKESVSIFTEERVTEGVFHTNTGHSFNLSEGLQAMTIIDWLTQQKHGYFLKKVTILVSGADGLQSAQCHIEKDRSGLIDYISNGEETQQSGLTVELVGESKELVETAEKSVLHIFDKIMEDTKGTDSETSKSPDANRSVRKSDMNSHKPSGTPDNTPSEQEQAEISDGKSKVKDSNTVTAEINPGIVKLKLLQDMWDSWVSQIRQKFQVEIQLTKSGIAYVEGLFNNILKFESYLENEFVIELESSKEVSTVQQGSNASTLQQDGESEWTKQEVHIQMTSSEYRTFLQFPAYKALCEGGKCSQVSYDQSKGCLQITCLGDISKAVTRDMDQTLAEIKKEKRDRPVDERSYNFLMSGILIAVRNGNLVNENVDCCILPAPPRLNQGYYGLLKEVTKVGGEQFRKACVSSGGNTMEEGECRLVTSESLSFTKEIVLVKVPLKPDPSFISMLSECLSIADKAGSSSVALPLLALSKDKGVSISLCADWYLSALRHLKGDCKSLKRVVFVDMRSGCIEQLKTTFGEHFKTLCTDFNQSSRPDSLPMDVMQKEGMEIAESGVNIFVATGDLSSICADALICLVDQTFYNKEQYLQDIKKMASSHYRLNMSFEQEKQHSTGDVKEIACSGGRLSSKFVIHAVLLSQTQMTETFKVKIAETMEKVFDVATGCSVRSLAIPVSKFENAPMQELNMAVIENTIRLCRDKKPSSVKEVHFVTTDSKCQMATIDKIFEFLNWGTVV